MALWTKESTVLKQFAFIRTYTLNTLWIRNKSTRQGLPKFPYPNADTLPRHQPVKARPPPICPYGLNSRSGSSGESGPQHPKRYVEFLRDDAGDDDDEGVATPWMKSPAAAIKASKLIPEIKRAGRRPVERTERMPPADPADCMSEPQAADNANANGIDNDDGDDFDCSTDNNRYEWNRQPEHSQRQRAKSYFEKVFKIQHENMQRVHKNVKRIKQRLENERKQQRIQKLMQLQRMVDDLEPALMSSYKPKNYSVVVNSGLTNRHGLQPFSELLPEDVYNVSSTTLKDVEFNPVSDYDKSGDVAVTRSPASMIRRRPAEIPNVDRWAVAKKLPKESAMCKLCNGMLVQR